MPISQTEGFLKTPSTVLLMNLCSFLCSLKWNLWEKASSCVKTKTNSDFAVKVAERTKGQPFIFCLFDESAF